jgi:regulator of sigma E protease
MGEFVGSLWWLIVTLGLLVTFHEFGHFIVARRFGVKVLRFSVGFGRPLALRRGADGTEYVVAAIPLGGYVKMLDEREGDVAPADADQAFNRKPVGARIAIVAAGPAFNLVFAVIAFWAMFVVGRPDFLPVLGPVEGLAAEAGLRYGDRVLAVDGDATPSWTQATIALIERTMAREDVAVAVRTRDGDERTITLPLSRVPPELEEAEALRAVGLRPARRTTPAVVAGTAWFSGAARAGLEPGDRVLAVGDVRVGDWAAMAKAIQAAAARDSRVPLLIDRNGGELRVVVEAKHVGTAADGTPRFQLGIEPPDNRDALLEYGPIEAIPAAFAETWRMTSTTFKLLGHLVFGRASLENVSGPIGIAQSANLSVQLGFASFLFFLGLLSLSIGILNLLPIPILDGGHLLYYLIELVKGSPVTERTVQMGQAVGLALLFGLMGLAFYNDISRIVSS